MATSSDLESLRDSAETLRLELFFQLLAGKFVDRRPQMLGISIYRIDHTGEDERKIHLVAGAPRRVLVLRLNYLRAHRMLST